MATTQYATFELDGHLFAVEVNRVQEVFKTQPSTPVRWQRDRSAA